MPTFSVIIPAYNAEGTVECSIQSVLDQTYRQVEVVAVDDGSTDGTLGVLQGIAVRDDRVKVVRQPENRGLLEARRAGVAASVGRYLTFLDADDALNPDTLNQCFSSALDAEAPADVVQFAFEIHYANPAMEARRAEDEAFFMPFDGRVEGDDVTHLVFRDRKASWNLCGKLFERSVLERAYAQIEPSRIFQAEDAYTYFIASHYAQSYCGLPQVKGYVYGIEAGGSAAFSSVCKAGLIAEPLRHFMAENGLTERYRADYDALIGYLTQDIAGRIFDRFDKSERPEALATASQYWQPADIVPCLFQQVWARDQFEILSSLETSQALRVTRTSCKTVGVYYFQLGTGGAERVTLDLCELWMAMGMKVVVFTDTEPAPDVIPDGAELVLLPLFVDVNPGNYAQRARMLQDALAEHEVDVFVYCQWMSHLLQWDMLVAKMLGIAFVVHTHGQNSIIASKDSEDLYSLPLAYRMADAVVTLSKTDTCFWKMSNTQVFQTINPVSVRCADVEPAQLTGKNILWLARLDPEQKCPAQALLIFDKVRAWQPDAQLYFVGGGEDADVKELKQLTAQLGIADAVHFEGVRSDVTRYYGSASVFLMTSKYEGYPLTLAECGVYGVPVVMYDLPYLDAIEDGRGIVAVPMGDAEAAAKAICALLADSDRRKLLGAQARERAEELECFDRAGFWQKVFAAALQPESKIALSETERRMWNIFWKAEFDNVRHAHETIREYEESLSYKLGRKISWLPRKARDAVKRKRRGR